MATPAPAGGANFLTRKLGPLPTWAWAGLGVVGFLYWRQRQAASASSAGAGTPALSASDIAAEAAAANPQASLTTPSGLSYSGPLSGLSSLGSVPTGALATTAGSPFANNSAIQVGSGELYPTGQAPGGFQEVPSGYQAGTLLNQGQTLYYVTPGSSAYTPYQVGKTNIPGTPLYAGPGVTVPSNPNNYA